MSHDFFPDVKLTDDLQKVWVNKLLKTKVLDNTIFIMMSDHGIMHGSATKLAQSQWELNSPLNGVRLPKSFIELHREEVTNLGANRNSLITPFDIHKTLTDIIRFLSVG